jgi:hypothetical protein
MDPCDPVDAAALRMHAETRAYLDAMDAGENPSPAAMIDATEAYRLALRQWHDERGLTS